jgi:hypothetical protein
VNRGGSHFLALGEQDVLAEAGSVVLAGVPDPLRLVCRGGQIELEQTGSADHRWLSIAFAAAVIVNIVAVVGAKLALGGHSAA